MLLKRIEDLNSETKKKADEKKGVKTAVPAKRFIDKLGGSRKVAADLAPKVKVEVAEEAAAAADHSARFPSVLPRNMAQLITTVSERLAAEIGKESAHAHEKVEELVNVLQAHGALPAEDDGFLDQLKRGTVWIKEMPLNTLSFLIALVLIKSAKMTIVKNRPAVTSYLDYIKTTGREELEVLSYTAAPTKAVTVDASEVIETTVEFWPVTVTKAQEGGAISAAWGDIHDMHTLRLAGAWEPDTDNWTDEIAAFVHTLPPSDMVKQIAPAAGKVVIPANNEYIEDTNELQWLEPVGDPDELYTEDYDLATDDYYVVRCKYTLRQVGVISAGIDTEGALKGAAVLGASGLFGGAIGAAAAMFTESIAALITKSTRRDFQSEELPAANPLKVTENSTAIPGGYTFE